MTMEWTIADQSVDYALAVHTMEERVAAIRAGKALEQIWCLEHPPLYTAGTSAKVEDLVEPRFPVYQTGRGGQYTYHGPGQMVVYVMLDLKKRAHQCHSGAGRNPVDWDPDLRRDDIKAVPDIKQYVHDLEQWIIDTLDEFGIKGERREGRVGIWVDATPHPSSLQSDTLSPWEREASVSERGEGVKKIAAIGVRVRHWVTYHGISINLNPDLSHYSGIVPCGIHDAGVTSFTDLNVKASSKDVIKALKNSCPF